MLPVIWGGVEAVGLEGVAVLCGHTNHHGVGDAGLKFIGTNDHGVAGLFVDPGNAVFLPDAVSDLEGVSAVDDISGVVRRCADDRGINAGDSGGSDLCVYRGLSEVIVLNILWIPRLFFMFISHWFSFIYQTP